MGILYYPAENLGVLDVCCEDSMKITPLHKWRILYVIFIITTSAIAVGLILYALRTNIDLFYTPADLMLQQPHALVRVGGEVKTGSLEYSSDLLVNFVLTDYQRELPVSYQGILPDLFREEQAVVVRGKLLDNVFYAEQILAKHDQNYIPPELVAKLKE